jgi:hypothetical protein
MKEGAESYLVEKMKKEKEIKVAQPTKTKALMSRQSVIQSSAMSTASIPSNNSNASQISKNQLPVVQKSRKSLHAILFKQSEDKKSRNQTAALKTGV